MAGMDARAYPRSQLRDSPVPFRGTGSTIRQMSAEGAAQQTLASLLREAEGARRLGLLGVSRHAFLAAAQEAIEVDDVSSLVTAALGIGGLWVNEHRDVVDRATARSIWARARAAAAPGSLEQTRLIVREAAEAVYEGAPSEPVEAAVEQLRTFGDDGATAEALSLLHHVRLGPAHARERLALADEIIRLGASARSELLMLMGLCWRTIDLFLLGDPHAGQCLTEFRERSERTGTEAFQFIVDVLDAMLLARGGKLEEAEQTAAKGLERGISAGDPDAPAYHGSLLTALRWWQGRAGEVLDVARELAVSPRLGAGEHVYVAAVALLSASVGDSEAATEALAQLNEIGLSKLPDSSIWLTTQFLVVEAAFMLGDARTAEEAAELIAPFAALPVMPSLAVTCLGSARRSLGLAAALSGDLDGAVVHLESAISADRALRSRPMILVTEHTLAGVLRARGQRGDSERAASPGPLETRAERMGMTLQPLPEWLTGTVGRARQKRATLIRVRSGWAIELSGRTTVLPDLVGFQYLARLITEKGRDLDTMSIVSPEALPPSGPAEPLLDREAIRLYRQRVKELEGLLSEAGLPSRRATYYEEELETLRAALSSATGLHGHPRSFPADRERARTAVRKAIVRAIESLGSAEPELASHLRLSVETGTRCRYTPGPSWTLDVRLTDEER